MRGSLQEYFPNGMISIKDRHGQRWFDGLKHISGV